MSYVKYGGIMRIVVQQVWGTIDLGRRVLGASIIRLFSKERQISLDDDQWDVDVKNNKEGQNFSQIVSLLKIEQVFKYPHIDRRVNIVIQPVYPDWRYPEIKTLLQITGVPVPRFSKKKRELFKHMETGLKQAFSMCARNAFESQHESRSNRE